MPAHGNAKAATYALAALLLIGIIPAGAAGTSTAAKTRNDGVGTQQTTDVVLTGCVVGLTC